MAVRAQALPNRSLEQTSTCFVPHFAVNSSTWWSSNEVQSSQSLPKNLTSEVVFQPPPCQQMKPLGLGLQGDDSYSTQSNSNSPLEVTALGKTGSQDQCTSSGSGTYTCTLLTFATLFSESFGLYNFTIII